MSTKQARFLYVVTLAILIPFLFCSCSIIKPAKQPTETPPAEPDVLRIMCYNIHVGKGIDKVFDLSRIADVINSVNPDIVALQEVDRFTERTEKIDELSVLSIMTQMKGVYGKTLDFQGGEYGIAILSDIDVVRYQHYLHPEYGDKERRGFLTLVGEKNGKQFRFVSTHLGLNSEERAVQIKTFLEESKTFSEPLIIAGDFNFEPDTENWEMMHEYFIDAARTVENEEFTFPAIEPVRRIDYVWLRRDDGWKPLRATTINTPASDHLPLVVEVQLPR